MRNFLIILTFIALLQPARSIYAEDYYQIGHKLGKELGSEIGREERTRCVEQHRAPISVREAFQKALFDGDGGWGNRPLSLFLKEQGIDPSLKTTKDKRLFNQTINQLTELLQNDAFGEGFTDGFAKGYFLITQDALYEGLCDKQLYSRRMSDWGQGYIDGHNHAKPIGFRDKKDANPTNWLIRYSETNFRYLDSDDAQYLDGFEQGFKAGYLSGYK